MAMASLRREGRRFAPLISPCQITAVRSSSTAIRELLDSEIDVNFRDIDNRTALHVAACQGQTDVVSLLLQYGAIVDSKDRWGSTPLADAIYYKNHEVIKLLEKHGAKHLIHLSAPNVEQFINLLLTIPAEGYQNSFVYVM